MVCISVYNMRYTLVCIMVYYMVYINLTEKLAELLLLRKGQFIQIGTLLGLGRKEHHIPPLTCERKVSTILQNYTQLQAPVYAAASAARQGCERSMSGAPSRTPNTVSLMYNISTSSAGVWSLNRVATIAATRSR